MSEEELNQVFLALGRLEGKLDSYILNISELRNDVEKEFDEIYLRLREVERAQESNKGFLAGARWLWGVIVTLPTSALAFVLGRGELKW